LPRPAVIDCLAQSIAQMPLCPQALIDARATASRLIQLLPASTHTSRPSEGGPVTGPSTRSGWMLLALLVGAIAMGMAANLNLAPKSTVTTAAPANADMSLAPKLTAKAMVPTDEPASANTSPAPNHTATTAAVPTDEPAGVK